MCSVATGACSTIGVRTALGFEGLQYDRIRSRFVLQARFRVPPCAVFSTTQEVVMALRPCDEEVDSEDQGAEEKPHNENGCRRGEESDH